jgi:hypothetical protein
MEANMRRHQASFRALLLLLPLIAGAAAAQTVSDRPQFELGAQVTMLAVGGSRIAAAGPHLTVNFGRRSAVSVAGEWQVGSGNELKDSAFFLGQLEQSLWQSRQGHVFVTAGVGLWHNSGNYPSVTLPAGFTIPAQSYSDTTALFVVGAGFTLAFTQRLMLRATGEVMFVSGNPGFRLSAGFSVPMGRFQPMARASLPAEATPSLGSPESRVQPGKRVWVTSIDGRERRGTIQSVSNGILEVDVDGAVTPLLFADIRRIETRGTPPIVKGALVGAFAGGIPMVIYMGALCANEGCSGGRVAGYTMGFAALGAGVGALIGAALEPRPRVLYDSGRPHALAVAPMVSGRGLGVGGAVRW